MLQQIIALVLITIFIWRLGAQKKKRQINQNEFIFWLAFWIIGILAIVFIRDIDSFVNYLGFSGSGINFLLYLAIIVMFYLIFKLRLNMAKMDKNITEIVRQISLDDKKK